MATFENHVTVITADWLNGVDSLVNTVFAGATTTTAARTAISAAKSGANSDITSLTGLTTALTFSEGGTGEVTQSAALTALLGSDQVPITNGGTGESTAAAALTALGGVASSKVITKVKTQIFTASGTYTPTVGMVYCIVELQAAGGGGAGVGAGVGSGGSAGAYCRKVMSASDIGTSQTVTLGAFGTGGTATKGNDAVSSSFGAILTAGGGKGGSGATAPGAFTSATGGDVNINGSAGAFAVSVASTIWLAGDGGDSVMGFGGKGNKLTSSHANGLSGLGYGSGGAGSVTTDSTPTDGGNGAPGICIITEFIANG